AIAATRLADQIADEPRPPPASAQRRNDVETHERDRIVVPVDRHRSDRRAFVLDHLQIERAEQFRERTASVHPVPGPERTLHAALPPLAVQREEGLEVARLRRSQGVHRASITESVTSCDRSLPCRPTHARAARDRREALLV